ncbi:MAG: hypothetical protein AB7N76_30770 [Planctomycetota bacterium]
MSRARRDDRPRQRRTAPSELPVLSDYYALLLWSFERAEGFPKVLRPSLTQRFLALLLEGLEGLLEQTSSSCVGSCAPCSRPSSGSP